MAGLPPPSDAPSGRRPTLGKTVMMDTSGGRQRVRRWPRKRATTRSKEQRELEEKFRQTQKAMNFVAPGQYLWFVNQVKDSPLLPRDVFTMQTAARLFAFILPNGRILWPMVARTEVSEALDVLSAVPGDTLIRTEQGWVGTSGGGGGGAAFNFHFMELQGGDVASSPGERPIPVDTILSDPAGWCDLANYGFVPDQPGWYLLIGHSYTNGGDVSQVRVGKNGVFDRYASVYTGANREAFTVVGMVEANGTTDILQCICNQTASGNFYGTLGRNWQALIGPLS